MSSAYEPTPVQERIGLLDATRGVAVLGILLLNIVGFGLPNAYEDPTNWGGASGANLHVWRLTALFFEGTMRGLFTLLFGAGALLFLERHGARNPGLRPADLYFRRTLWLIVFGLINGYLLLWEGDILFYYGATGLVLFVFRTLEARTLIAAAIIVLGLQTLITSVEWRDYQDVRQSALAAQQATPPLNDEQLDAIDVLRTIEEDFKPTPEAQQAFIQKVQASYASAFHAISPHVWRLQTDFFFRHGLLDCLGMMLLGMALLRLGVLTGAASARTYAWLAALGYPFGLAVNLFETSHLEAANFSVAALMDSYLTYDLGRAPLTLGHIGLIGLLFRTNALRGLFRTLGAVGRMALTNYLAQSVICLFVFTGAGLGWYGRLERHELYYVVLAIWLVQLLWSPWWLNRFRFGPAEWLWRSLTYWRRQPMRRTSTDSAPVAAANL